MPDIVLIGCGSIGNKHYANATNLGGNVIAAADPDVWRVGAAIPNKYDDPEECLKAHAEGNAVIIASPTKYHARQAFKAIQYGCSALLVEKPLALNQREVAGIVEYAEQNSVRAAVAYNYRFHRIVREVLAARKDIVPGLKILFISSTDDIRTWPSFREGCYMLDPLGGGVLLTSSCHSIDLALHLLGKPVNVSGVLVNHPDYGGVDSIAILRIVHEGQNVSVIGNRWERPPHSVICHLSSVDAEVFDMMGSEFQADRTYMHAWMMEAFLNYANGEDKGHLCGLDEAMDVVKVIDAARAAWEKRTDVAI